MLRDRLGQDLAAGLKNKDSTRVSVIRMLMAAVKNREIEKRVDKLDDKEVISVIKKSVKQHKDSIEQFQKGNREDLVEKEKAELLVLEGYLPKQLTREEIEPIVKEAIKKAGASSRSDTGKVMKLVMGEISGNADGKMVSQIVGDELGKLQQ